MRGMRIAGVKAAPALFLRAVHFPSQDERPGCASRNTKLMAALCQKVPVEPAAEVGGYGTYRFAGSCH